MEKGWQSTQPCRVAVKHHMRTQNKNPVTAPCHGREPGVHLAVDGCVQARVRVCTHVYILGTRASMHVHVRMRGHC